MSSIIRGSPLFYSQQQGVMSAKKANHNLPTSFMFVKKKQNNIYLQSTVDLATDYYSSATLKKAMTKAGHTLQEVKRIFWEI